MVQTRRVHLPRMRLLGVQQSSKKAYSTCTLPLAGKTVSKVHTNGRVGDVILWILPKVLLFLGGKSWRFNKKTTTTTTTESLDNDVFSNFFWADLIYQKCFFEIYSKNRPKVSLEIDLQKGFHVPMTKVSCICRRLFFFSCRSLLVYNGSMVCTMTVRFIQFVQCSYNGKGEVRAILYKSLCHCTVRTIVNTNTPFSAWPTWQLLVLESISKLDRISFSNCIFHTDYLPRQV